MEENKNDVVLLKVDFAFKQVMQNKRILASLLSAILKFAINEVEEIEILPLELDKEHEDEKLGILDVHLRLQNKKRINIELQLRAFKQWPERSGFYLFKMFVDQVKSGSIYEDINPCISISILDFDLLGEKEYYNTYKLRNEKTGTLYMDKIAFHVLELPKLERVPKEERGTALYRWAKMLKAASWEEYEEAAREDVVMTEVVEELKKINQDENLRRAYLHRQIAAMDKAQEMKNEREEGKAEGKAEGEAKLVFLIRKKVNKAMSCSQIAELLELDESYVKNIMELCEKYPEKSDVEIAQLLLRP